MNLKLKELVLGDKKYAFFISVYLGLLSEFLFISVVGLLTQNEASRLWVENSKINVFYFFFLNPAIFLLCIHLASRYILSDKYLILSTLISVMTTSFLCSFYFLAFRYFDPLKMTTIFISYFILALLWFCLLQKRKRKIRALSLGYLGYLITSQLITDIQLFILDGQLNFMKLLSSILFFIIFAIIFELIFRSSFKVFKIVL
jgi:hypothetical protein